MRTHAFMHRSHHYRGSFSSRSSNSKLVSHKASADGTFRNAAGESLYGQYNLVGMGSTALVDMPAGSGDVWQNMHDRQTVISVCFHHQAFAGLCVCLLHESFCLLQHYVCLLL